jgi:hypothetical protein
MPACDRGQSRAGGRVHDPAERVVQRGHGVDGADRPPGTQLFEGIEIGAVLGHGQRGHLQPEGLGEHLEAGVGERVGRDDVSGLQRCHDRGGQPVLGAADDQDLLAADCQPAFQQMTGDRGSVAGAAAMGLVAQERFQITGCRELP